MPILTIYTDQGKREIRFDGEPALRELLDQSGVRMNFPCGGRGICGKCRAEIITESGTDPTTTVCGTRRICKEILRENTEIHLKREENTIALGHVKAIPVHSFTGKAFAAADIGTTTIVLNIYDGNDGKLLASESSDNPQITVSGDVAGRITAAGSRGKEMTEMIRQTVCTLADQTHLRENIEQWIITGNTTMLYLFSGRNPASLGTFPFHADTLFDTEETFDGGKAYYPPCIHAYAGADTVCAVLASGISESDGPSLLCDIGTNGEIVLWKNGKGFVTSVAAGPVLEGFGIRCGCRGIPGAVNHVTRTGSGLYITTIGHQRASGICGSGILDAVAAGLEQGYIDAEGMMKEPMKIAEDVFLYPEDIRQVQLAKAAVYAGITRLLQVSGTDEKEIERMILCGGFGSEIRPVSAARIGLISGNMLSAAESSGNLALQGAAVLYREKERRRVREITKNMTYINLGGDKTFNQLFIRSMRF